MHEMFVNGPGHLLRLNDRLCQVLAPNPSPMTGPGTNTYLLGQDTLAIIDPGPADPSHLASLLAAINGRTVSHIIVTHSHVDHSPLARGLSDQVQAPIHAFGDTFAGRSPVMQHLAEQGMAGGGEGLDLDFAPDIILSDGDTIAGADWTLDVLHTPGHLGNHVSLVWDDAVFVGDMVMDWSTSLVSPPDGDMSDFLKSCRKLHDRSEAVFYPGHGAPLADPRKRLAELITHRDARTEAIMLALRQREATLPDLVNQIYVGLDPRLAGAAGRNVFAHLVALWQDDKVIAKPVLSPDSSFSLR